MRDFGEIERRIERLYSDVSSDEVDGGRLAEMGDLLAEGYASALEADAHGRRLGERIDVLLEDFDRPDAAHEAKRLAKERRAVQDAARRLRSRLEDVRAMVPRSDSV
jgi:hypothetical protein